VQSLGFRNDISLKIRQNYSKNKLMICVFGILPKARNEAQGRLEIFAVTFLNKNILMTYVGLFAHSANEEYVEKAELHSW
jgi:hypothetical protein